MIKENNVIERRKLLNTLIEEQVQLVKKYRELLLTVNEGFDYVIASYSDLSKTEGDMILQDIINAFIELLNVNDQLLHIFKQEVPMLKQLRKFSKVTSAAEQLASHFDHLQKKQQIVKNVLYPAFHEWFNEALPLLTKHAKLA